MANYYDQDFEPWVRGIRGLGTMIAQAPMRRAAIAQREQQGRLTEAQIATQGSVAGLNRQRALELMRKGELVTTLERTAGPAMQAMAEGRDDDPTVTEFNGAASALTGQNRGDVQKAFKQGLGTMLARRGDVAGAAGVENPVSVANATAANTSKEKIAAGAVASREKMAAERGTVLQPGAALVRGDKVVLRNPSAAAEREGEYETTTETYPATQGTPEVPGKPGTPGSGGWLGTRLFAKEGTPAVPAIPAVPGTPERKVTTRRKLPAVSSVAPAGDPLAKVPAAAIEHLKSNPDLAAAFDEKYGPGMAKMVLGK